MRAAAAGLSSHGHQLRLRRGMADAVQRDVGRDTPLPPSPRRGSACTPSLTIGNGARSSSHTWRYRLPPSDRHRCHAMRTKKERRTHADHTAIAHGHSDSSTPGRRTRGRRFVPRNWRPVDTAGLARSWRQAAPEVPQMKKLPASGSNHPCDRSPTRHHMPIAGVIDATIRRRTAPDCDAAHGILRTTAWWGEFGSAMLEAHCFCHRRDRQGPVQAQETRRCVLNGVRP